MPLLTPDWQMKKLMTKRPILAKELIETSASCEQANNDLPVTVHISRRVRPGFEADYEATLAVTIDAVKNFQGFHDAIILRPAHPMDQEYRVILHFEHCKDLQRWEQSKIRRHFIQQLDRYSIEPPKIQVVTGLETWFTLPSQGKIQPPPRYKMLLLTWLAVLPLGIIVNLIFSMFLSELPMIVRNVIFTVVIGWSLTYLIMPRLTRLFSYWLYPQSE
jgi:uncharacterized protein